VYHCCRLSGLRAEDAADVLQEVFRAVLRAIPDFRREGPDDTFRGWLRVITRNKIRDHFRRVAAQPAAVGGTDAQQRFMQTAAEESDDSGSAGPLSILVRKALALVQAEFEPSTWQAFWQATVEQRSTAEIAKEMGVSQAAVRQAKCRVLRRLRLELGDIE